MHCSQLAGIHRALLRTDIENRLDGLRSTEGARHLQDGNSIPHCADPTPAPASSCATSPMALQRNTAAPSGWFCPNWRSALAPSSINAFKSRYRRWRRSHAIGIPVGRGGFAASKRANAARQLLKRPAARFPPLPCRRLGHPAGHRLYEQPPRATSDSRALVTSVLGRSRIRALFQACNGRLIRNREMPDEVSTLSLLACSHQGLCPTCHCVLPAGHRRCCP